MSPTTIHKSKLTAFVAIKEEYETLPKVTYLLKLCQLGATSDEYKICLVPQEYKLQVWLNNISLQVWDLHPCGRLSTALIQGETFKTLERFSTSLLGRHSGNACDHI